MALVRERRSDAFALEIADTNGPLKPGRSAHFNDRCRVARCARTPAPERGQSRLEHLRLPSRRREFAELAAHGATLEERRAAGGSTGSPR
jgi:hypothetical protein